MEGLRFELRRAQGPAEGDDLGGEGVGPVEVAAAVGRLRFAQQQRPVLGAVGIVGKGPLRPPQPGPGHRRAGLECVMLVQPDRALPGTALVAEFVVDPVRPLPGGDAVVEPAEPPGGVGLHVGPVGVELRGLRGDRLGGVEGRLPLLPLQGVPRHRQRVGRLDIGLVAQFVDGDRGRQTLQSQLAHGGEDEAETAFEEAGHEFGAEYLAGFGPVAEALGRHDGGPEVVSGVAQRLAGGDPDPDRKLDATDRMPGSLLHGDGAGQGVGGRGEGDHEPIAQPLHLVASIAGHGVGEDLVMGGEDPLGLFISGPGEQFGRSHEVGEQQRHQARTAFAHAPPSASSKKYSCPKWVAPPSGGFRCWARAGRRCDRGRAGSPAPG